VEHRTAYLCIHGHFYQPPREDPFTGKIPQERGAEPFANYNEKITAECYAPNARARNFAHISFDIGPTLAAWLEQAHPDIYALIIASDRESVIRDGVGAAMAQAYNHTILPLASARDKRTQIRWGLTDFAHRFGRPAEGMWLAETAVDIETLDILAQEGVRFTILAPWQAAQPVETGQPYRVELPEGRSITAFFYQGPLSGAVSFDRETTANADTFAHQLINYLPRLYPEPGEPTDDQVVLIATDGELYGHHKEWRDAFLTRLVQSSAAAAGFELTTPTHYLLTHPATRTVELTMPSAWSCSHGVARWSTGCACTEGSSEWKPALRAALTHLGRRLDATFERVTTTTLSDPWAARDDYISVRSCWLSEMAFWACHGIGHAAPRDESARKATLDLLEAEYFGQAMSTSCGFFFEDLDRIEPRNDIAFARRAISLVWQATGEDLQSDFVADLAQAKSGISGRTGAQIYRALPAEADSVLPSLAPESDESAA
jgi:alpha-amylase/alpha-mannosidase (GH57 family)